VNGTDRSFWSVFLARAILLTIGIIGTITWLAIFEHNYHPRIYRYNDDGTILQISESALDFNHPDRLFGIWGRIVREDKAVAEVAEQMQGQGFESPRLHC